MSRWRRSSTCAINGCIEVLLEVPTPGPREGFPGVDTGILLRSSRTAGTWVAASSDEWRAFIAGVKLGEFDL